MAKSTSAHIPALTAREADKWEGSHEYPLWPVFLLNLKLCVYIYRIQRENIYTQNNSTSDNYTIVFCVFFKIPRNKEKLKGF